MRWLPAVLVVVAFAFTARADDVGAESRRTVVMDVDETSSATLEKLDTLEAEEVGRFYRNLTRKGRDKLVEVPGSKGILLHNARLVALKAIARKQAVEDDRAARSLLRAGDDVDKLDKVVERYPHSVAAAAALKRMLEAGLQERVLREWKPLLSRPGLLDLIKKKETEPRIYIPASEIHPVQLRFPGKVTGDLVLRGSIFARRRPQLNAHGDVHEMPRFPQSSVGFLPDGIALGDYRGLIRFRLGDRVSSRLYETKANLLGHLDNNVIGDMTVVGDRVLTSQRSTAQKRDTQKNLYIVELSRQQILSFHGEKNLKAHPRYEQTRSWEPEWSLSDDKRTYNGSVVVRGETGYCTATWLSGLFNIDVVAFDIRTGKVKWSRTIASGQQELNYFGRHIRESAAGIPLIHKGRIYVSSNVGTIHCLDLDGRPLWTRRYERVPTPVPIQYYAHVHPRLSRFRNQMPRIVDGRLYVSPTDSDSLHCLDADSGNRFWAHRLNPKRRGKSYPHEDFWRKAYWHVGPEGVILYDKYRLYRLDAVTGESKASQLVNHRLHYVGRPLFTKNSMLMAAMNSLYVIDRSTLKVKQTVPLHRFGIRVKHASLFWNGKDICLVDEDGNLFLLTLGNDS